MVKTVFAIRDLKGSFLSPFLDDTSEAATRGFAFAIRNGSDNMMRSFPEDFSLYEIGTFDTESGMLISHPAPKFMASAVSFAGPSSASL